MSGPFGPMGGDNGRPPKPIPLRGPRNLAADRNPYDGGVDAGGTLRCPDWVSAGDPVAQEAFDTAVVELRQMGLEASADVATVGAYAIAVARMAEAAEILAKSNVLSVSDTADGRKAVRGNPAGREFQRYFTVMRACATQLGFTPSARTRINAQVRAGVDGPVEEGADQQVILDLIAKAKNRTG